MGHSVLKCQGGIPTLKAGGKAYKKALTLATLSKPHYWPGRVTNQESKNASFKNIQT